MALQPRQSQFTPNRFFDPDSDFLPGGSAQPPAPQPAAAQPGDLAKAAPAQPGPTDASGNASAAPSPASSSGMTPVPNAMASPQDFYKANMPARPTGDFDKIPDGQPGSDTWANRHTSLRRGLAAAFAGLAEYGGQQNHTPGMGTRFADRWLDQDEKQRQFDANQGKNQAAAKVQGSAEQLGQEEVGARVGLTKAQTQLALQNLPAQEAAEKLHGIIQDAWLNKKIPPQQFDQWAQEQISAAPANVGRMVSPHLAAIKQMQPTGKGYALTMQDDLPKSVNVYGKEYDRNDPELEKVAPGAGADFDRAMAAHSAKRGEKLQDEKDVAGFAADRQAQGFVHADQARTATENFQNQEKGKAEAAKHLQTLREAQNQNDLVQQLASSKSPTDQTSLAFKALGLDLPDGVHRINETELNAISNQGSLSDRAKKAILGWTTGQKFAPNILEDIKQTANKIAASKMKTANDNLEDVNRNFGYRVNGSDERGRFDGTTQASGVPVGATATHSDGSKWKFNGGDPADVKNWTKIG